MALLPVHNYFISDGRIKPVSEFDDAENYGIYEVIRVERGVLLFLGDHLSRLFRSATIAGKTVRYKPCEIEAFLKLLILKNKIDTGNILISCNIILKIYFVAHKYPEPEMYKRGVDCGILKAERDNPNVKSLQTSVRQKADELIAENNFYEILLIDKQGRITEGSRSNVFFITKKRIITPPGNSVLLGVTRQKTIQLAQSAGFGISEHAVLLNELPHFDALFITGTSPKILPVKRVGKLLFNPQNPILQSLLKGYNEQITAYIKNHG